MTLNLKQHILLEEIKSNNRLLLESSCRGLTSDQERIVRGIYQTFTPLIEATLTPDQIKQLFAGIEQGATAAGGNRTGLGKAADVAKLPVQAVQKVNDIINQAGKWVQDTAPVKAFDQKFEDLKAKISAKFPDLAQNLSQVGAWAKANPGKTAVIIGVLTALAGLAGGPLGGAIAGQVLRGTSELMKGEKLSTAVGKGVKTAAIGAAAGGVINLIKDLVPPEVITTLTSADGQTIDVNKLAAMAVSDPSTLNPEDIQQLLQTQKALVTAARSAADPEAQQELMAAMKQVTDKINELGGSNSLMQQAGITGRDLQMQMVQTTDNALGATQTITDAYTITADELNKVGINFATEPPINNDVVQWATSKGIDPQKLQQVFQMEKAMEDAQFINGQLSAKDVIESWSQTGAPMPTVTSSDIKDVLQVGQINSSEISVTLPGLEKPISFSSTFMVEGVDANGKPVFSLQQVNVTSKLPFEELGLEDEQTYNEFRKFLDQYTGINMASQAGAQVTVDTFKQQVASSIGVAASAAAIAATIKDKPVQGGAAPAPAGSTPTPESFKRRKVYRIFENVAKTHNQYISEIQRIRHLSGIQEGIGDTLKGLASKGIEKAKQVGTNLTTKITADKLMKAWQAAGSPTDDAAIAAFLQSQGVDQGIIDSSFTSAGLTPPTTAAGAAPTDASGSAPTDTSGSAPTDTSGVSASAKLKVGEITKFLTTANLELKDLQEILKLITDNLSSRPRREKAVPTESIFYSGFLGTNI